MSMDFGVVILAHLCGDFVLQNDYIARRKTSSSAVCALHCVLYTLAYVALLAPFGGWPAWAYLAIAVAHYPIDRYGLARRWMQRVGQKRFADSMAPWSVIVVDNTAHLIIAYLVFITVNNT